MSTLAKQLIACACLFFCSLAALAEETEQELLNTFRQEFIPIQPGKGPFPKQLVLDDTGRRLAVETPFAIAKYEIPQNLYQAVMGNNPSRWKGPRNSAEMFDYHQANRFCEVVTQKLRKAELIDADQVVRLPTEVEWEYCCRAGTKTNYSFGDKQTELGEYCWFHGNAAGNDPPVGAKKPNPWGLYDVHGYLWEFCSSENDAATCVLRGGAWTSTAEQCQSSSRRTIPKDQKGPDIGLRCVLTKSDR